MGTHGSTAAESHTGALAVTGWLTGIYFVIELAIGLASGSVAVISDAFHTFSAVGGVLIALVAGRIAARPASTTASFGWIRAEIVGALLNGLFLLLMAAFVFWMGARRLQNPIDIPTAPMFLAAAGGLITEAISLRLLYQRQKGNLNVKGAFWHVIQTFVGSLLIIVAAVVMRFTGFLAIDPLLGMGFGVVLLWASWRIIRDALAILLEKVPEDLDLAEVIGAIEALEPVRGVHHPHAWSLTTGKTVVSMHVLVDELSESMSILREIHALLRDRFGVFFSTVQLESECLETPSSEGITISGRPVREAGPRNQDPDPAAPAGSPAEDGP